VAVIAGHRRADIRTGLKQGEDVGAVALHQLVERHEGVVGGVGRDLGVAEPGVPQDVRQVPGGEQKVLLLGVDVLGQHRPAHLDPCVRGPLLGQLHLVVGHRERAT